jgi:hypothetical protein
LSGRLAAESPISCVKSTIHPGEIPAEYFILLNNFLIFIAHYAADDHLICDLLPADHFL